jgi:cytidine deaminase
VDNIGQQTKKEKDISDELRQNVFIDILQRLQNVKWLKKEFEQKQIKKLVQEIIIGKHPELKRSYIMNIIEFGRTVHAEMAALIDALRRGVNIKGSTLYVTTFPCHECARHIVAAGIILNLTLKV